MIPNEGKLALLGQISQAAAAAGPYDAAELKLYVDDLEPSPQTVLADLTEATFDGYAAVALAAWGEAYLDDVGDPVVQNPSVQFNHAGTGAAETVHGWFIESAGGVILEMKRFDTPKTLATAVDSVVVVPDVQLV